MSEEMGTEVPVLGAGEEVTEGAVSEVEEGGPVSAAEEPDPGLARPWHGSDNPLESLYQWVVGELSKVRGS